MTGPVTASPADNPALWYAMPELTGTLVRLVPLQLEHADGWLTAARPGEEVFEFTGPTPSYDSVDQVRDEIAGALAARSRGERFPYAQLDTRTGEVIGSTSLYEVNPAARALAIGHTWLGRQWWRTGYNTDAKLLLLTHAFETLGAARVVWHTDVLNLRSQAAIERLGATKEGVLRKHRIRRDGTWRDTVQYAMTEDDWPAVRERLTDALAAS
ncbi:MAG TPA: GNAT family protein [Jatrophihabitans sp.]|jgi:RimJ/RimL family protein N-acetyltransferase